MTATLPQSIYTLGRIMILSTSSIAWMTLLTFCAILRPNQYAITHRLGTTLTWWRPVEQCNGQPPSWFNDKSHWAPTLDTTHKDSWLIRYWFGFHVLVPSAQPFKYQFARALNQQFSALNLQMLSFSNRKDVAPQLPPWPKHRWRRNSCLGGEHGKPKDWNKLTTRQPKQQRQYTQRWRKRRQPEQSQQQRQQQQRRQQQKEQEQEQEQQKMTRQLQMKTICITKKETYTVT